MAEPASPPAAASIVLSVVAPAHNEEDNLRPLATQIIAALQPLGVQYEIVIVDDGSTDSTPDILRELMRQHRHVRAIRMSNTPPGRGHGQSAAFHAGFRASRGAIIAVLDADLQNDPADIPAMLEIMRASKADMVQGDRSHARADTSVRKASSWVGRFFRRNLLGDDIRDTGCSLRLMRREVALAIPLEFRGIHRFIPVTARRLGFSVVEMPVNHRPRVAGVAKYGIMNRAIPGLIDCLAVRWMFNRRRPTHAAPLTVQALADIEAASAVNGAAETSAAATTLSPFPRDAQLDIVIASAPVTAARSSSSPAPAPE
jgi:glycosyltransferase involved in cell wall biosynthesis